MGSCAGLKLTRSIVLIIPFPPLPPQLSFYSFFLSQCILRPVRSSLRFLNFKRDVLVV